MRYDVINNELFQLNRKNLSKQLKKNSIAFIGSNVPMPDSADAYYKWRQNPDLFYLTGIDQEESFVLLFPDAPVEELREILFIRPTNELLETWEGKKLTKEQARTISGIKEVRWSSDVFPTLFSLMHLADHVYLNTNEHDRASWKVETYEAVLVQKIRHAFPLHRYERLAPIMAELRTKKSTLEVGLLNRAIDITHKGFLRTLQFVKPGVWEYEIEAELTHEYLSNRATRHAYEPIVATGENACFLHYNANNTQCKSGELLLMDCAAEYANYCSDLTRTIPVNGKFSKRQKEVYNAVLSVHKQAVQLMKPGIQLFEFNKQIGEIMEGELIKLKLLKPTDVKKQDKKNPLYKKYFPHGTAHFLGLNTHDVGSRYHKIPAGAVLTCEPGIYIREEKIGIRIENNILVTKDKPIDLMANIPIEADEIEAIMNKK
ncbi:MAG: aminopeptidase P N-terminal domain-containing protein [Chitinophagales bacterium]|nr:aminopeptidase P N-terminal domain-containing protein [Chitinophagales bacterium]